MTDDDLVRADVVARNPDNKEPGSKVVDVAAARSWGIAVAELASALSLPDLAAILRGMRPIYRRSILRGMIAIFRRGRVHGAIDDSLLTIHYRPANDEEILACLRDPDIAELRPRNKQRDAVRERLFPRPVRERDFRRCRHSIDPHRKPGPEPR
jgi:hypothetical protein